MFGGGGRRVGNTSVGVPSHCEKDAALTIAAQTNTDEPVPNTLDELSALTLSDWLWAGGLIVGSFVAAIVVRRVVEKVFSGAANPLVARLLGRLAAFGVFALAFIYALRQIGVSVGPLLGVLGLAGLALAFAFQGILENFIAGVLMSLRRPFAQGDQISSGGFDGIVDDINLRAVELRTYAGERVYLPNATVWKSPIVNHTALGARRTTLDIGVDYDADLDEATQAILDAVDSVEGVKSEPRPEAFVHSFGGSSVDIAVRFWHEPEIATEWRVRDAVARSIKVALDTKGIGIPFPQQVVHFAEDRSVADGLRN